MVGTWYLARTVENIHAALIPIRWFRLFNPQSARSNPAFVLNCFFGSLKDQILGTLSEQDVQAEL